MKESNSDDRTDLYVRMVMGVAPLSFLVSALTKSRSRAKSIKPKNERVYSQKEGVDFQHQQTN